MTRERMTIAGLVAIGVFLAKLAPPQWLACEMLLLAACVALLWENFHSVDRSSRLNRDAWFANSSGEHEFTSGDYRPWDVEQSIARLRTDHWQAMPATIPVRANRQSIEQIANEKLTQAFSAHR